MFKRPNIFFSLFVSVPSVLVFGTNALTLGLIDLFTRSSRLKRGEWGPVSTFTKIGWSSWMLWVHSIRTKVHGPGAQNLKSLRGCVFVANHQSLLDIPVLFKYLPDNLSFIAKKELLHVPVFGWAAWMVGTIFIDRSKGTQNESLKNVVDYLKAGISLAMFPEGTRSETGELKPFKRGAFIFAIQAGVPIVPITIVNSRDLMPKHRLAIAPGEIEIYVHEPISTKGMVPEDRVVLSDRARAAIESRLQKHH